MNIKQQYLHMDTDQMSRRLLLLLVCTELFFVLLDIVVNYLELIEYSSIHRLCNIAREDGLAAWFMTSQTLVAALVLWFIYWLCRHTEGITAAYRRGWLVLALFFSYMSADDGAMVHERVGTMFEEMLKKSGEAGETSGLAGLLDMFPSYEWHFMLPFFMLIGLYVLYFLWKVLGLSRPFIMVLAAFSCFGCAVILDFIEGIPKDHALNVYSWMKQAYVLEDYTVDHFAKSLEEFLEMLGISLFLAVFVGQAGRIRSDVSGVQFGSAGKAQKE